MIKALTVKNIRAFSGEPKKFEFAPLTVICGTNSSGKSTLLKTFLLLRQSQGIKQGLSTPGRLQCAGSQVDLGNYASLVSNHDTSKNIQIDLDITDEIPVDLLKNLIQLLDDSSNEPLIDDLFSENTSFEVLPYSLNASFVFRYAALGTASIGGMEKLEEDEDSQRSDAAKGFLESAKFSLIVRDQVLLTWFVRLAETNASHQSPHLRYELVMPDKYFRRLGGKKLVDVIDADDSSNISVNTILRGLLPDRIFAKLKKKTSKGESEEITESWVSAPLPLHIELAQNDLHRALNRIHYLGPLRSPAQRFYVSAEASATDLDSAGVFLPTVLRTKSYQTVVNWKHGRLTNENLIVALDYWLKFLRTGIFDALEQVREIEVLTTRDVLVEIMIRDLAGGNTFPLADSGFGYSQVMPILIRGLLAKPGNTLVVEQPELHLNPCLQVRLGHFFADMAKAGKQIFIETHSEHIVNAIRVLSAEDETGDLAKLCKIIYMSSSNHGGSQVTDLSIRADGTVPDWPHEFFGEAASLAGRLLRARRKITKDEDT